MNLLLIAYSIFYSLISFGGIYVDFKEKYSFWIIFADLLGTIIGLSGLILYQMNYLNPLLSANWIYAFIVLVSCSVFVALLDIYDEWTKEEESWKFLGTILALTLLSEIPCFWINFLYAGGKTATLP